MKHTLCSLLIVTLCTALNLPAQQNLSSLTNKQKTVVESIATGALTNFSATVANNRVTLNWAVTDNIQTDRFEIEKSADGKKFSMIALVFGSELTGAANYEFFEKLKKTRSYYRLKVIYKDGRTEYSNIIIPGTYPVSK